MTKYLQIYSKEHFSSVSKGAMVYFLHGAQCVNKINVPTTVQHTYKPMGHYYKPWAATHLSLYKRGCYSETPN